MLFLLLTTLAVATPNPPIVVGQGHRLSIDGVSFSPDDRTLLSMGGGVVAWETASGRELASSPDTPWRDDRPFFPGATISGAVPLDATRYFDTGTLRSFADGKTLAHVKALQPSIGGHHAIGLDGIWELATMRQIGSGLASVCAGALVTDVREHGGGHRAVVECRRGHQVEETRIVDLATRVVVFTSPGSSRVWISRTGGMAYRVDAEGTFEAIDLATGQRRGLVRLDAPPEALTTTFGNDVALVTRGPLTAPPVLKLIRLHGATLQLLSTSTVPLTDIGAAKAIAVSHSGHEVALAMKGERDIVLRSMLTGALIRTFSSSASPTTVMRFADEGRLLIAPGLWQAGPAWAIDVARATPERRIDDVIAASGDVRVVVNAERRRQETVLRAWNLVTGARLWRQAIPRGYDHHLRVLVSATGRYAFIDAVDGSDRRESRLLARIVDTASGAVVWERVTAGSDQATQGAPTLKAYGRASFVRFSADEERLVLVDELRPGIGIQHSVLRLRDGVIETTKTYENGSTGERAGLTIDDRVVAAGTDVQWPTYRGEAISFDAHAFGDAFRVGGQLTGVAWSQGQRATSVVYDANAGRVVALGPHTGRGVRALDSAGRRVVAPSGHGALTTLKIYDAVTGAARATLGPMAEPLAVAVHPTEDLVASGRSGLIELHRPAKGKAPSLKATMYLLPDGELLTVTPDGHFSATKGATRFARVSSGGGAAPRTLEDIEAARHRPDVVVERIGLLAADERQLFRDVIARRAATASAARGDVPTVTLRPALAMRVLPDSPAARAGITTFDAVVHINDAPVRDAAAALQTLTSSTEVTMRLASQAGTRDVRLTRLPDEKFGIGFLDVQMPISADLPAFPARIEVKSALPATLRVALNDGELVTAGPVAPVVGTSDRVVWLALSPGTNRVDLWATSEAGSSRRISTWVHSSVPLAKPRLFALHVGVSRYNDSAYDLTWASKDAGDLAAVWRGFGAQFGSSDITVLTDDGATRDAVLAAIKRIGDEATIGDEVVITFAGHGLLLPSLEYVLATHDTNFLAPAGTGVSFDELDDALRPMAARKKLLLIDACNSGEADTTDVGAAPVAVASGVVARGFARATRSAPPDRARAALDALLRSSEIGSGTTVIASSTGAQISLESAEWQNGVFTYAVASGLRDRRADLDDDGKVTVAELKRFVVGEVSEKTRGAQRPVARREHPEFDYELVR